MGRRKQNRYIFAPESERRNRKGRGLKRTLLIFLVLAVGLLWVSNFIVSNRVRLEKLPLTVLNLPEDLEQYSILHLSDLHGASLGEHQSAFQAALGTTRYSCVVMTGDMLGPEQDVEPLLELISLMPAETPKYYVPGDTDGDYLDSWAHASLSVYTEWADRLISAGVTILDRPVSETRGKGTLWFVPEEVYTLDLDGMTDIYTVQLEEMNRKVTSLTADDAARKRVLEYELKRMEAIRETKALFKPADIQVVLTHTPLTADYARDIISWSGKEEVFALRYASLILAGHFNGGQWRIPFFGSVYVPELGWFPKDETVRGLNAVEGIPQHISPGLGSDPHYTNMPGRIFNPPEATLITLTNRSTRK